MPEAIPSLWVMILYGALVVGLVALVLCLSALTGPRHAARRRDLPYESGMPATGASQVRLPIAFYLIALDFLIFDVEAAILFAWAGSARETGWTGFVGAVVFVLILLAGLAYVWAKGSLDWGPLRSRNTGSGQAASDRTRVTEAGSV